MTRKERIKKLIKANISLYSLIFFILAFDNNKITIKDDKMYLIENTKNLSYEEIRDLINKNKKLTKEEKEYLYNEEFIKDSLKIINKDNFSKYRLLHNYYGLDIVNFDETIKNQENMNGCFFRSDEDSKIYIKDYNNITKDNKDTISHEYIHFYQNSKCDYNLIIESTAEILSNEYFNYTCEDVYIRQVILTKILMETIGVNPIKEYIFNNNFNLIENSVKPYLTKEEYERFLNDLKIDTNKLYEVESINKLNDLYDLISIIYKGIYNKDMKEDKIIDLLDNKESSLVRYYFNNNYPSFYITYEEEYLDIETAYKQGYFKIINNGKRISLYDYLNNNYKGSAKIETLDNVRIGNKYIYVRKNITNYLPAIEEKINKQKTLKKRR